MGIPNPSCALRAWVLMNQVPVFSKRGAALDSCLMQMSGFCGSRATERIEDIAMAGFL